MNLQLPPVLFIGTVLILSVTVASAVFPDERPVPVGFEVLENLL